MAWWALLLYGLAAVKLTAIGLLTPLLLFTRTVGPVYIRALRYLGLSIYFVPVYVYLGLYHGCFFVDRHVRSVLNPHSRQRWIDRTRSVISPAYASQSFESLG